ncbi:MAG: trigger factor [Clostridiales bacterium]|nr:trigger factor [Clostridiales bacterium]
MSVQVEKLEHNMAMLTVEVEAAEFDAACKKVYNKKKGSFNLPGFRKGKVPMNVIERTYGVGVFYEDAANDILPKAYTDAVEESGVEVVSQPEIDVTQIGKGENFIFTATVAVKPEVTLGQYKGLEVEKQSVEVTEEEINEKLVAAQNENAREITIEDRPVKEGDIITLNYAGTIDGVPFDGGTADNQKLEIGSHSFIDTFEDQLVGLNIGDEKDVEVTFPEKYHAEELAGKPAVFHVEILGITEKQLPEIDDDFAQDTTEFDSLEEYKEDIRKKLTEGKEEQAKTVMENALVDQIVANSEMDIPEAMIDSQVEQMMQEYEQRMSYQGITFDRYLQFTGQSREELEESMRPDAEKRIQSSLVLEAIVAAESIEATDEDVNKEYEKMAAMYQMDVEQIASYYGEAQKEDMKKDLAVQKAVKFVLEQAVVTEASEELDFEEE